MKLHTGVVEKLLYMFRTYGGYETESKLRGMIQNMDLTPYDRKSTGETVLVLTDEFVKQLSGPEKR